MCEEMGGTVEAIAEHFWILLLIINALSAKILFHSLSALSSCSEGQACSHW
jgi:hypothetical protein